MKKVITVLWLMLAAAACVPCVAYAVSPTVPVASGLDLNNEIQRAITAEATKPTMDANGYVDATVVRLANYAALLTTPVPATSGLVYRTAGYTNTGDGGASTYIWNSTSVANGDGIFTVAPNFITGALAGSVTATTGTPAGRFLLDYHAGIAPEQAGATCNGVTNDINKLNTLFSSINNKGFPINVLETPGHACYFSGSNLNIKAYVNWHGAGNYFARTSAGITTYTGGLRHDQTNTIQLAGQAYMDSCLVAPPTNIPTYVNSVLVANSAQFTDPVLDYNQMTMWWDLAASNQSIGIKQVGGDSLISNCTVIGFNTGVLNNSAPHAEVYNLRGDNNTMEEITGVSDKTTLQLIQANNTYGTSINSQQGVWGCMPSIASEVATAQGAGYGPASNYVVGDEIYPLATRYNSSGLTSVLLTGERNSVCKVTSVSSGVPVTYQRIDTGVYLSPPLNTPINPVTTLAPGCTSAPQVDITLNTAFVITGAVPAVEGGAPPGAGCSVGTNVTLVRVTPLGSTESAATLSVATVSGGVPTSYTVTYKGKYLAPTQSPNFPAQTGAVDYLSSSTLVSGGTGYSLNDIFSVSGGVCFTPTLLQATGVTSGVITAVTTLQPGVCTTAPVTGSNQPLTFTGGTGSGASINGTYHITVGTGALTDGESADSSFRRGSGVFMHDQCDGCTVINVSARGFQLGVVHLHNTQLNVRVEGVNGEPGTYNLLNNPYGLLTDGCVNATINNVNLDNGYQIIHNNASDYYHYVPNNVSGIINGSITATVSGGAITGLTVANAGGSGTPGIYNLIFSSGAAAGTYMVGSDGSIYNALITSGGSGYGSAPTVSLTGVAIWDDVCSNSGVSTVHYNNVHMSVSALKSAKSGRLQSGSSFGTEIYLGPYTSGTINGFDGDNTPLIFADQYIGEWSIGNGNIIAGTNIANTIIYADPGDYGKVRLQNTPLEEIPTEPYVDEQGYVPISVNSSGQFSFGNLLPGHINSGSIQFTNDPPTIDVAEYELKSAVVASPTTYNTPVNPVSTILSSGTNTCAVYPQVDVTIGGAGNITAVVPAVEAGATLGSGCTVGTVLGLVRAVSALQTSETAAVVTVAAVTSGVPTSYTLTNNGTYLPFGGEHYVNSINLYDPTGAGIILRAVSNASGALTNANIIRNGHWPPAGVTWSQAGAPPSLVTFRSTRGDGATFALQWQPVGPLNITPNGAGINMFGPINDGTGNGLYLNGPEIYLAGALYSSATITDNSVPITNGGQYNTVPTVTFSAPGGSGTTAIGNPLMALMSTGYTIVNAGDSFNVGDPLQENNITCINGQHPNLRVASTNNSNGGGAGGITGLTFNGGGQCTVLPANNTISLYTSNAPTGTPAAIQFNYTVVGVQITNGGGPYTSTAPTATFSAGTSTAIAGAIAVDSTPMLGAAPASNNSTTSTSVSTIGWTNNAIAAALTSFTTTAPKFTESSGGSNYSTATTLNAGINFVTGTGTYVLPAGSTTGLVEIRNLTNSSITIYPVSTDIINGQSIGNTLIIPTNVPVKCYVYITGTNNTWSCM